MMAPVKQTPEWLNPPEIHTCAVCGKKITLFGVFIKQNLNDEPVSVCCFGDRKCFTTAYEAAFKNNDLEFVWIKGISDHIRHAHKQKREPIGLAKRYSVMKRDGFKCVLCGKSADGSKLEVDHILPVIDGGDSRISNLQTLCFECNRGKGAK